MMYHTNSVEDLAFSELSLKHMKSHEKTNKSETYCIEVLKHHPLYY